jgi:predicted nucleic acid-binding protein
VTILDTNVLSELMRPRPAEAVLRWVATQAATLLYTTAVTEAEILLGVMQLAAGRRRTALEAAAHAMFEKDLGRRVLPFGTEEARLYARIASERRRSGRPISHFDAQIAAIARAHDASLATRNVSDFQGCGITVVDPWTA